MLTPDLGPFVKEGVDIGGGKKLYQGILFQTLKDAYKYSQSKVYFFKTGGGPGRRNIAGNKRGRIRTVNGKRILDKASHNLTTFLKSKYFRFVCDALNIEDTKTKRFFEEVMKGRHVEQVQEHIKQGSGPWGVSFGKAKKKTAKKPELGQAGDGTIEPRRDRNPAPRSRQRCSGRRDCSSKHYG